MSLISLLAITGHPAGDCSPSPRCPVASASNSFASFFFLEEFTSRACPFAPIPEQFNKERHSTSFHLLTTSCCNPWYNTVVFRSPRPFFLHTPKTERIVLESRQPQSMSARAWIRKALLSVILRSAMPWRCCFLSPSPLLLLLLPRAATQRLSLLHCR